ncbi:MULTISPECIES: amino acid permease [unclassified Kitasatospora]|uniref:amino acid permease n=1 Tax=unclassified Kitasatospora TaxID=2633591 RepID=UPI00070B707F|nr:MULTISPECIES: amino acid permease [unclassified Kitasatospora]KQV11714.1 proline-specific permease [Kitasatospora sp. Root107]KRB76703.1 proline-specific permease [Kitasatospora sp. Root187]
MTQQQFDEVTDPVPDEEGYARGLGSRQIQMIAIGGAIGTGLFLGAGTAISKAGPSLILSYAVAGLVIFVIMRALGELLTYRPVSGSFAEYAREFLGPFAGYVTGWTYWLFWVVTGMAETTAAAVYVKFWAPGIPQWISALVFLVILYGANLISVKLFGEIEFWFSMIKVTAIIGMILIGIGVLTLGFSDAGDTAALSNLWSDGGFFPKGIGATVMTLQIVMFAYLGVELVGVTAGESENPQKTLPRAINTLPWRIALFYIGALVVILAVVPWREFAPGVSPFVAAFEKMGIPAAAGIINFVVLTAALSSCNSGMYSTGRMLRDLAIRGQAPGQLTALNRQKTPAAAITVSCLLMGLGVVLNYLAPAKAFEYITSVATVCGLWTWAMILICQIRYRTAWKGGHLPAPTFKAPGGPAASWASLAFLVMVIVLIAIDEDSRISLYVFPVWALLLVIGYQVLKSRKPEAVVPHGHDHVHAKSGD